MSGFKCDVFIAGGGLGGVAAAVAIAENGFDVILCEETNWIGGQLTSQAVPPDEHPWIESFGSTSRYRSLRKGLREIYLRNVSFKATGNFNPGLGWVSAICARPDLWHQAIMDMLAPSIASGKLKILTRTVVSGGSQLSGLVAELNPLLPEVDDDAIRSLALFHLDSGRTREVEASYFLDATELGDLLPLCGAEWITGSEATSETGEAHGSNRYRPENQQGLTWVFAMSYDPGSHRTIDRPDTYGFWRSFRPSFWPNPLFHCQDLDPLTNQPRVPPLPLFSDGWRNWFNYRQIHEPSLYKPPHGFPTTIVNWPQNDYFLDEIILATPTERQTRLSAAKEQSLCLLYWMQTECPREDGDFGYPGLFLNPTFMGTADGFAMTPYIRESRRIRAMETILEKAVSADNAPSKVSGSVGVGSYRIDLHPSTGGDPYIDLATAPFQIPLGSLIPVRIKNLLPACKNIGSTHVTNGCYRLHPVEWNIGESAGLLACFCLRRDKLPVEVYEDSELTEEFQTFIQREGVEIQWPPDFGV